MFYILDGNVTFWIEDEEVIAPKGTYINVPKGLKHYFRNQTKDIACMLFLFSPSGIERMSYELAANKTMATNPPNMIVELNDIGK